MKGDRPACKYFCPYCLSDEKIWETKRVICASCGQVIGWREREIKGNKAKKITIGKTE